MILKQSKFLGYIVAAVLWLQYVVNVMSFPMMNVLYFNIRAFRSSMCSVPIVAVFCSYLVSCFTVMWSGYFLINVEIFPGPPVITSVGFVFYIRHKLHL
jgi:hypothetical protein